MKVAVGQALPEIVHIRYRIIRSWGGPTRQKDAPVGSRCQCTEVDAGANGDAAGKRRQPGVEALIAARRNHGPQATGQPEASMQLKDTSKHECAHGGGPEGEGSRNRRNDEETVSAGPGGELAEGGPHHRLQRENRWLLETQNECGSPCLPGRGV